MILSCSSGMACSLGLALLAAIAPFAYHPWTPELVTKAAGAPESASPNMRQTPLSAAQRSIQRSTQRSIQHSVHQSSSTQSSNTSQQQTTLNLNSADLDHPYLLSITTSGEHLNGQVTLDGQVIQTLKGDRQPLNLSPYLTVGQHTVDISAHYAPASATIRVEFSGSGTAVSQQSSGTGVLDHRLIIQVD